MEEIIETGADRSETNPDAREIYLDNNASTRPLPVVMSAMTAAMTGNFGNPSSAHQSGERARVTLEISRSSLAHLLGANAENVIFTSSGTESNNLCLSWVLGHLSEATEVVTSQIEHSSIQKMCDFLEDQGVVVVRLPVSRTGRLDPKEVDKAVTPRTKLVSIQWVNNETGVIQPIEEISTVCRARGVLFHTDAAQAVGKVPISLRSGLIDFVSLTAHKIHGPQGVGAAFIKTKKNLLPILHGGPQENGLRPGTENLPGIAGLGAAAAHRLLHFEGIAGYVGGLKNRFEKTILSQLPGVHINGLPDDRVFNTTNLRFDDVDGQALVAQLDGLGIRCSQSSACTNSRPEPSYVLRSMGLSEEEAYASIRFSFSELNTEADVDHAGDAVLSCCSKLRGASPGAHWPYKPTGEALA